MRRRHLLKLTAAAGLLAGCARPGTPIPAANEQTEPPNAVKIGLLLPRSGPGKPVGDEIRNGFELYLARNAGQLGGQPVVTATADEGDTAGTARAGAERLVRQERVLALVGVSGPAALAAAREVAEAAHVPLIAVAAAPAAAGDRYVWRAGHVTDDPGKALGGYLGGRADGSAYLFRSDSAEGRDVMVAFRRAFPAARIAGEEVVATGAPVNLAKLHGLGVKTLFCCLSGLGAADFVHRYRQAGLTGVAVYGTGCLTEGDALTVGGEDALGLRTVATYAPDLRNPVNRVFAADYAKRHGHPPTMYAAASYDAAILLDRAVAAAPIRTPEDVNAALGKLGMVDSPRGPWQFTADHAPSQRWYLREVRKSGTTYTNALVAEL